jgi:putative FmdB family regulatory protein
MPIYEYLCKDCGKKSSFLILSISSQFEPRCKACGSLNLKKLISRVAVLRSEESRLESLADPSKLSDLDEKDPKSVARWMKKFGREMGEEVGPEFNQEVDRAIEEAGKGESARDGDTDSEPDFSNSSDDNLSSID